MKTLAELRAALKSSIAAIKAFEDGIVTTTADKNDATKKTTVARDMTAEEVVKHTALLDAAEAAEKAVDAKVRSDKLQARGGERAADQVVVEEEPGAEETEPRVRTVRPQVTVKMKATERMGLIAMGIAASQFHLRDNQEMISPLKILEERGYAPLANEIERTRKLKADFIKALNAGTQTQGGYLTPDILATDIIELLYPETTFLQGEPVQRNMPNGTYRQAAGAASSTASYRKEGGPISVTEPAFREVNMSAKFLGAIVPMTRQMIDFSLPSARSFIETDLRERMSQVMDQAAYFGTGIDGEPLGATLLSGIQTVALVATGTAPTLPNIDQQFTVLRLALFNNNIRNIGRWRYVMAPRTLEFLQKARVFSTADGSYAYPETRMDPPRMGQIPILVSTNIPINLGVGGNESTIFLINFGDMLMGIQEGLAIASSIEATVIINGSPVSAFQNDLIFIRATSAHDFGSRRPLSFVQVNGVLWGS